MPSSITEALDNLYTTTWQNMKGQYEDQIFDSTPLWFWMKSNGGIVSEEGGKWISEPLRFAKSDNVKFIGRGGTVSLNDKQILTIAKYDWKYMVDSIVRFGIDDQQNRGKNAIMSLMNAKLQTSRDSLTDKMEIAVFGKSLTVDPTGLAFNGLQDIIPADPTVTGATLGGIDPSVDTWWRNQTKNMAGISMATNLRREMLKMVQNCGNNLRTDKPDIIFTDLGTYEAYDNVAVQQKQIVNQKLGDAGFVNLEFQGIPVLWGPQCLAQAMYFINSRHLKFKRDPMMNFDMTEWKAIPDQVNDRAAQIITAGELVTGRRRCHGIMHTLNTA